MRSYPGGLAQLVSGWTKNIASGASAASPIASLATVLWICAHHVVALGARSGARRRVPAAGPRSPTARLGGRVAGGRRCSCAPCCARAGTFRWWTWALFPLPLLAFDLVFARSAVLTVVRRSVRWRGRPVDLRRDRSTAGEVA